MGIAGSAEAGTDLRGESAAEERSHEGEGSGENANGYFDVEPDAGINHSVYVTIRKCS